MPFTIRHPEYRTKESIKKLRESMKRFWADRWLDKKCPNCKKDFRVTIGRNKIYCSRLCAVSSLEIKKKISDNQKGKIISAESRLKMSISAKTKHRKGIGGGFKFGTKHWNWNGGISSLRHRLYNLFQYRDWRRKGFERDNYTCVLCNQNGGMLHFDHYPKSFAQIIKENQIKTVEDALVCKEFWDLNNGRTLCINCHRKTSNYGNRGRYKEPSRGLNISRSKNLKSNG